MILYRGVSSFLWARFLLLQKNFVLNGNVDSFISFPIIHVSGLINSLWKITLISLSVDYCIIAISSCAKGFSILYFLLFFIFLNFVNFYFQFIILIFALITLFIVTSSNFLKPWHQAIDFEPGSSIISWTRWLCWNHLTTETQLD